MIIRCIFFLYLLISLPAKSMAAAPSVTVSIAPLHSVVTSVMKGVGVPELLLPPAKSVHGYQLKPSDMKKIAESDMLFWGGPGLEVFLPKAIEAAGIKNKNTAFLEDERLLLYPVRHGAVWEEESEHHHEEKGIDPHFWLLPENMGIVAEITAERLGRLDPSNAKTYKKNAALFQEKMILLGHQSARSLENEKGKPFFVFHDAFQYFEKMTGLSASGAIMIDPHHVAGAKRISEIREKIKNDGAVCLFTEPQLSEKQLLPIKENLHVHVGTLDPLGVNLKIGEDFYQELIHTLTRSLKSCLSEISAAQ